jgi:alkylation response protein AidB-like acyl-CoA dehydrogenase
MLLEANGIFSKEGAMNYGLTDDQASVLDGLDQLLASEAPPMATEPHTFSYLPALDATIAEAGFIDIAREEGFGLLDAALVSERLARLPHVVEAGASSIVAPGLGIERGVRPIAMVTGSAAKAARFLPMAKLLLVDRGDTVLAIEVDPENVTPVETLFAYPYGKLRSLGGLVQREIGDAATLRRRWRIALAVEAAGCMKAALDAVVEHVKTRYAFGRPLGAFQGIQHRLAMAAETVESTKWLAFRAAWSDSESDAAIAATFAQSRIAQITFDLHQFSGAMGLTLEYPLHLWSYRLRALAGELGGSTVQARAAANATWGQAA